jgi:hypothetical protein
MIVWNLNKLEIARSKVVITDSVSSSIVLFFFNNVFQVVNVFLDRDSDIDLTIQVVPFILLWTFSSFEPWNSNVLVAGSRIMILVVLLTFKLPLAWFFCC